MGTGTKKISSRGLKTMIRPNRFNASQLMKVGVELLNPSTAALRCVTCGQQWSPNIKEGGRFPKNYWVCPNDCNAT